MIVLILMATLLESDDIGYNEGCFGETIQMRFEYVIVSGFEFIKFSTDDGIIDFISLIGNNMIPTAIAVGEKDIIHI